MISTLVLKSWDNDKKTKIICRNKEQPCRTKEKPFIITYLNSPRVQIKGGYVL